MKGSIYDSYYMHEYNDNFVFVYTNYNTRTDTTTNGLCVLNDKMELIGKIENLGVEEEIYASYFIDNMAYFVTFRNTDPVFAVDISNPKKPTLRSELKLPGFSSYLHSFGESRLIGIGNGKKQIRYSRGRNTLPNTMPTPIINVYLLTKREDWWDC